MEFLFIAIFFFFLHSAHDRRNYGYIDGEDRLNYRLFLTEQSDQGLHCVPFHLQHGIK